MRSTVQTSQLFDIGTYHGGLQTILITYRENFRGRSSDLRFQSSKFWVNFITYITFRLQSSNFRIQTSQIWAMWSATRLNSNFWKPSRAFVFYQADQWVSDLRPGIAGPTFWSRRFDPGQDTRDGMETRVNYWEVVTGLSIIFYHRVINRPVPDCLPAPSTGAWRDSDDIFTRIIYQTQQTPVINPMPVKC